MSENKKLRLLVTTDCNNKCPLCCNNNWDFSKLPVVSRFNYEEIMITGGEPMLHLIEVYHLIYRIRELQRYLDVKSKFYIYTSLPNLGMYPYSKILFSIDGITVTPHNKEGVDTFVALNKYIRRLYYTKGVKNKDYFPSLRLNLFPDIKKLLPKRINLSLWKIKDMEWIKDCPVPEGEDFRRISTLFNKE